MRRSETQPLPRRRGKRLSSTPFPDENRVSSGLQAVLTAY
jgi:hypothetical protein